MKKILIALAIIIGLTAPVFAQCKPMPIKEFAATITPLGGSPIARTFKGDETKGFTVKEYIISPYGLMVVVEYNIKKMGDTPKTVCITAFERNMKLNFDLMRQILKIVDKGKVNI